MNHSLSRRGFLAGSAAAVLSQSTVGAEPQDESLLKHVHPAVRVVRKELPEAKNAFWKWKAAHDKSISLYTFAIRYFEKHIQRLNTYKHANAFEEAVSGAYNLKTPIPTQDVGDCLQAWLKAQQPSLKLLAQGIALGRFQIPAAHLNLLDEPEATDDAAILGWLPRVKAVQLQLHLHRGKIAETISVVDDLLKISSMTLAGDGFLIHHLMGMSGYDTALEAANAVAAHAKTPAKVLAAMRQRVLDSTLDSKSLARACRIEFIYFTLPEYSRYSKAASLRELVDILIKRNLTLGKDEPDGFLVTKEQVDHVRQGMRQLLKGHPQPFDAAATTRLGSQTLAAMLKDLGSPWLARKKDLNRTLVAEVKAWPASLSYAVDLLQDEEPKQATEAEIQAARKKLLPVVNPVGKHMLRDFDSYDLARRGYHLAKLRREISLSLIASRQFWNQKMRPPESLSELVDAKFLDRVPVDPFSGNPVKYDPKRRLIWSHGFNEKDDNGDGDVDSSYPDGDDLVWRIRLPA